MDDVESKRFPFTGVYYTILVIQLIAGLLCCATTLHCSLLDTGKRTRTLVFLSVVYFPLRVALPFVALLQLNWLRTSSNSPFPITVPQNAYNSLYITLRNIYSHYDLKAFTGSNAARKSVMNLDRGLMKRVRGSILHSFMAAVALWLLGVLDVNLPPWIPNVFSAGVTVLNFLGIFSCLFIQGIVLTQQSFETTVSGYRFDLAKEGTLSDQKYFQPPYKQLRGTWNSLTITSFFIILCHALFEEKSSFPFQGLNEECQALWKVTAVVFLAADLFSFWSDSRVMAWGSLPASCCCLAVLAASLFHGDSHNGCRSSQALGHARHLLMSHLLLVRLVVVFLRPIVLAYHHWRSSFTWTNSEISTVIMSVIGLGIAIYSTSGVGSILYSVGY